MRSMFAAALLTIAACMPGSAHAEQPGIAWTLFSEARGAARPDPDPNDYFVVYLLDKVIVRQQADGSIFVAATGYDERGYSMLVMKLASDGSEIWRRSVPGIADADVIAQDLAVDAAGNAYLVGISLERSQSAYLIAKLGPDGTEAWRGTLPALGTHDRSDTSSRVFVDAAGGVYVAGVGGWAASLQLTAAKWSATGVSQWKTLVSPQNYHQSQFIDAALDATGRLTILSGGMEYNSRTDFDTVQFAPDGRIAWLNSTGFDGLNVPSAIALDGVGNVYITGSSTGTTAMKLLTIKYDVNGTERWRAEVTSPDGDRLARPYLTVDQIGNATIGAQRSDAVARSLPNSVVSRFAANGAMSWSAEGPAGYLAAIALDAAGSAYGAWRDVQLDAGFSIVKYEAIGREAWRVPFKPEPSRYLAVSSISPTADGGVLVSGNSRRSDMWPEIMLVKIAQPPQRATVSVGVARDATYVYADSLYLTAMARSTTQGASVSFFENGQEIPGCNGRGMLALAPSSDVAVAQCYFDYPFVPAPPYTSRFEAVYAYPSGHPLAGTTERAARDYRVLPGLVDRDGLYVNDAENGWGVSVTQHGEAQFVVVYAYDASGKPAWYAMPEARPDTSRPGGYTGLLYRPSSAPFDRYDAARLRMGAPVGQGTLAYRDAEHASLTVSIDGVEQRKDVTRYRFGTEDFQPKLRVGDLWWGGEAEGGWGVSLTQQGMALFVAWFTYGPNGSNTFLTVSSGSWSGTTFSGEIYATTSSPWLGVPYDRAALVTTRVGTLSLDFIDQDTANMTYLVGNVTQSKRIRRFAF